MPTGFATIDGATVEWMGHLQADWQILLAALLNQADQARFAVLPEIRQGDADPKTRRPFGQKANQCPPCQLPRLGQEPCGLFPS